MQCKKRCGCCPTTSCKQCQMHVHEFVGSTMLAEPDPNPKYSNLLHNHRFAGVTGPAIGNNPETHIHIICTKTDFFANHYHEVEIVTGPPIFIKDDKGNIIGHVHRIIGKTSTNICHNHTFKGTTLIENPIQEINPPKKRPCCLKEDDDFTI